MIGFLFPALLIGLAAIAVPVIIHFFYRRQLKVIPISTLRFLKIADETLPRQPRLQHLLLLLLRCILVALLAFFLAKPYFSKSTVTPTHRVVLLDRSLSMTLNGSFDEAKKRSEDLVRSLRYQDNVTTLVFDQNPTPVVEPRNRLREPVVAALDSTRPTNKGTAPRLVLQDIQRYFNEPTTNEAFILTDLRAADVPEWLESLNLVREAKHPGRVVLVPCSTNAAPNFAITGVRLAGSTSLVIQVSSSVAQPFDKKVETIINDQNLGAVTAHSERGEPVTIEIPLSASELVRGSARLIDDDALPLDNQRFFCFKPSRSERIFLVDGVPSRIRSLSETYYLTVALSTLPDDRMFDIATGSVEQLPWDNLEKFGTILFANVASFTGEQADRINAFARAGGNVIFTLGDQIDSESYNRVLRLPAKLGPVIGEPGRRLETFFLGEIDPGFDGFSGNVAAFRHCRFFAFYDLEKPDAQAHVLGRFNTGQPFLLESVRVYLFASSVSAVWNDFPLQPVYLPFWRNFFSQLAQAGSPSRQFLVGDSPTVKLTAPDKLVVLGPNQQPLTPVITTDSVTVPNIETPGLYRVVDAAGNERDPGFAVNIPARESLTAPATAEDLARLKSAGFEILSVEEIAKLTQKPVSDSVPLAAWLALLVAAAAAGEWAFSNHLSKEGGA